MPKAKKQQKEEQSKLNKEQKIALEEANKFQDMFPEISSSKYLRNIFQNSYSFHKLKVNIHLKTVNLICPNILSKTKRSNLLVMNMRYLQQTLSIMSGRLLGGNLTPRQFAIMYGATGDDKLKIKLQQGNDREQSKENRRHAALLLEKSYQQIQACKEIKEKIEAELMFRATMVHQRLQEKEYYFDEGLGVSVNDHIKKIQRDFPDLEVSVRRDRDGYPVIKTLYKPKFKYNLDSFLNFDAQKEHQHLKETTEILLSTLLPLGKGAKDLSSLTKEQLEQSLQTLMPYNLNNQERFDFDAATHQKLSKLVDERMEGRFRNDSEGFAQAILKFNETATYDKTRRIKNKCMIICVFFLNQ